MADKCCERDTDNDGNCDRHPQGVRPNAPYEVTIIMGYSESESVYPKVEVSHFDIVESREQAANFIKGAVLHCIGDWKTVPNQIHFKVVGVCHYCKKVIPKTKTAQCCVDCADERGP